jgi:hypothetical protein
VVFKPRRVLQIHNVGFQQTSLLTVIYLFKTSGRYLALRPPQEPFETFVFSVQLFIIDDKAEELVKRQVFVIRHNPSFLVRLTHAR